MLWVAAQTVLIDPDPLSMSGRYQEGKVAVNWTRSAWQ